VHDLDQRRLAGPLLDATAARMIALICVS